MSTTLGRQAEDSAAQHLKSLGYTIISQNWRTRWCEIDIIAKKAQQVCFTEVKYRSSHSFGSGIDYITPKKLQQMHFAAEFWLSRYGQPTTSYFLSAIELTGDPPAVTQWLEDIS